MPKPAAAALCWPGATSPNSSRLGNWELLDFGDGAEGWEADGGELCGRCVVRELEAIEFPLAGVSGGGWLPMRLANDRELPGIWSRSAFLDFCRRRFDDAAEAADDEGCCLDELGAGIPERWPADGEYADEEEPGGLGVGLGLTESCLI